MKSLFGKLTDRVLPLCKARMLLRQAMTCTSNTLQACSSRLVCRILLQAPRSSCTGSCRSMPGSKCRISRTFHTEATSSSNANGEQCLTPGTCPSLSQPSAPPPTPRATRKNPLPLKLNAPSRAHPSPPKCLKRSLCPFRTRTASRRTPTSDRGRTCMRRMPKTRRIPQEYRLPAPHATSRPRAAVGA